VTTELRRDADSSVDDNFTILISPNNDKHNGYTFTVNPLGTQFDALISDEGRINDPNWDGIWKSNAHITSDRWTATVAIPFSTLNFKTSDNVTIGSTPSLYSSQKRRGSVALLSAHLRH